MTRFFVLFGMVLALAAQAQEPIAVPILTYHRFDSDRAAAATVVTTPVFALQMAWLAANRYKVIRLGNLAAYRASDGPAVVLTADDGFRSVYTQMFPILKREGLPVTLFINPPMIGGGAYLTWAQIDEMVRSGLVDIEPHTQTHPDFNTERARRSPEAFRDFATAQIADSRAALQKRLGVPADLLAWPYGIADAQLEAIARDAGYVAAFALGSRAARTTDDPFAIPRYQVYDTDRGDRFAAIAEGRPRGRK